MQLRGSGDAGRPCGARAAGDCRIVHDIDLKDGKFGREETTGIASLVAGICAANPQDEQRVAQGAAVFDNLYQYFRASAADP